MIGLAVILICLLQVTAMHAALNDAKEREEAENAWRTFAREHQCVESIVSPGFFKCLEPTPTYWIESKHD